MSYSELANFNVIDSKNLLLFSGAELEDRNKLANSIEGSKDEASQDKRIGHSGDGISQLITDLNPVVVQPSTSNDSIAIKMSYVVTRNSIR